MSGAKFESDPEQDTHTAGFAMQTAELKPHYDFIVCGSGSSGSVVARRLAGNAEVSVLLLEAGCGDDMPSIMEAGQWPLNLGSERDWAFMGQRWPFALPRRFGNESSEVTVTIVSKRSSFGMKCVQCSDELIAPERSEYCSDKRICHVWRCLNCRCCFESLVLRPAETVNERHQVKGRYFLVTACRRRLVP